MDASAFNFSAMKEASGGKDPFANEPSGSFAKDDRFYTLSKDKDGNGAALIRFLPDSERVMIQKMFKINTTVTKATKRFVSEFSPSSIGEPCPFQERWQELWNSGDKEGSRVFSRSVRFVTNIKIIKDPQNQENEGKIFLYELSNKMKTKIQGAIDPSEQDRNLGAVPKEMFNPIKGNSFRLVAKMGSNNQINYDSSEMINDVDSIYDSVEDAIKDIKDNTYPLSDLLKPESFMKYDELVQKLKWVTFENDVASNTIVTEVAEAQPKVAEVTPASSLDDLLSGLT